MNLEYSATAKNDLAAIRDYIMQDSHSAANRTLIRIQQSIRYLITYPELGRPWRDPGERALSIPGFPYRVHYEIKGDNLRILTVLHTRRLFPKRQAGTAGLLIIVFYVPEAVGSESIEKQIILTP